MLLIKNGRVVDPVTGVDEVMDVLIDGAHIEEIGHNLSAADAEVIRMCILGILDRLTRRIF